MVSVLLERDDQLPEALHVLADLWARQVRAQPDLRVEGLCPVQFDIVQGAVGTVTLHVEDLPDWLHRMAEKWGERRARRRAWFRNLVPQQLRVQ